MDRTIFNSKLTDVDTAAKDPLGAIRCENGKFYKYVQFRNKTATVAGVAGDPAVYTEAVTLQGVVNNQVCLDVTDADAQPVGAGLLMASIAGVLLTSYYCWIQLTGIGTVPTAVTTGVLGSGCMPGGDKTLVVQTGVIHSCAVLITASGANNKVLCRFPF